MRVEIRDLVPISEAQGKGVSWLVNEANGGRTITLMKNGRPSAVVMDVACAERLAHVDEIEDDLKLLTVALIRMATDDGARHSLDDVVSDLGIDEDDTDYDEE